MSNFRVPGHTLLATVASLMVLAPPLNAQGLRGPHPLDVAGLPRAGYEDLRQPAGRVTDGVLRVALEATGAAWYPWGGNGPAVRAHTFAASGSRPTVPGPLIRASVGTPVEVTVRNSFAGVLIVRGLRDRGRGSGNVSPVGGDSVTVPPGEALTIRFTPTVPGTYGYYGRVLPEGWREGSPPGPLSAADRALIGALIVDAAGEEAPAGERIFLITHWMDRQLPGSWQPATRFMINGRSWPHTERLEYTQGDTVRWRVLNETGRAHPMHLHGFYFRVDAVGDATHETVYDVGQRRLAVTELLESTETMRITWVPEEPGNWIFHCHLMRHMSPLQTAALETGATAHAHPGSGETDDASMGGLVMGITVRPRPDHVAPAEGSRRRLELHIGMRPDVFDGAPAYGFVLRDGAAPASDSVRFPGSPIMLTRGEPAEIVVHNRADVPLGVHWHGLELESWADGVPGWSGYPDAIRPAIAPNDSFVVRMTPPRAGTFMYHVHSEPGHQLALGLYGAFLVTEQGAPSNADSDRLFLLGSLGAGDDPPAAVNGELAPGQMEFRAGTEYRLRFMHISPNDDKVVRLLGGGGAESWRIVAKDGADLPETQARTVPAELRIGVGETYDFLWRPGPGEYTLRIVTTFDRGVPAFPRTPPPPDTTDIMLRVR
jgi:manganese oxidase